MLSLVIIFWLICLLLNLSKAHIYYVCSSPTCLCVSTRHPDYPAFFQVLHSRVCSHSSLPSLFLPVHCLLCLVTHIFSHFTMQCAHSLPPSSSSLRCLLTYPVFLCCPTHASLHSHCHLGAVQPLPHVFLTLSCASDNTGLNTQFDSCYQNLPGINKC